MTNLFTVGISDWKLAKRPDRLRTLGLGSCVAIVLYSEINNMAGMAHIMLPDHKLAKSEFHPAKFADTAIPGLLEMLLSEGVILSSIKAKIAGGAEMFPSVKSHIPSIGSRNAETIKDLLKHHHIPLIAEDTGGHSGRTIEFDTETNTLHIRTVKSGEHVI